VDSPIPFYQKSPISVAAIGSDRTESHRGQSLEQDPNVLSRATDLAGDLTGDGMEDDAALDPVFDGDQGEQSPIESARTSEDARPPWFPCVAIVAGRGIVKRS